MNERRFSFEDIIVVFGKAIEDLDKRTIKTDVRTVRLVLDAVIARLKKGSEDAA